MRVVFIGASKFGERCLRAMHCCEGIDVVGAVTMPRTFSISYNKSGVTNVLHADITAICEERNIPIAIMTQTMSDEALFTQVKSWAPDAFVVAGWYHMVPKSWRDVAPAYGLHASLLPDYSGGAPLVWAIINGETKTGISLFQFDSGVDNGPIVDQRSTEISDDDDIASVYARIEDLGIEMLRSSLPEIANGTAVFTIQDETKRRLVPQRKPEDGVIDWSKDARSIYNFVRAQTKPYPGAFFHLDDKKITIWKCRVEDATHATAFGKIYNDGGLRVACGNQTVISISEMSINDGPALDNNEFHDFSIGIK